jgi:hypothetical protein
MIERFLWWTGAQWIAIGTCGLAVITLVYVLLTGRIFEAHESKRRRRGARGEVGS